MSKSTTRRPIASPTPEQLWQWASSNPDLMEKISTLPEEKQQQALRVVYNSSVQKYKSDSMRTQLSHTGDAVLLRTYLPIERVILDDLAVNPASGQWTPANGPDAHDLVMCLAVLTMVFREKTGQAFRMVDATRYTNATRHTYETLKLAEIYIKAQQHVMTAWSRAVEEPTEEHIAGLAQALHMGNIGKNLIFWHQPLTVVLDPTRLLDIYRRHRSRILSVYARLQKASGVCKGQ